METALQQTFSMFIIQCVRKKSKVKFGATFQYYSFLQHYYIFKYDKIVL